MMKKILVLCLVMMLTITGAALAEAADDRIPVAQNDRLALYLKADHCGFDVEDKVTGATWSSSMNDPSFTGKLTGMNQKKANSLLTVNVTNLANGLGSITNAVLLNEKQLSAGYELVENGVRVHYDLGTIGVSLDVEILLEGETVLVRVPYEQIDCYGDFSIVSIDMMPFLCSGSDNAEGFLFYPDGSGAILEFMDYAHFKETAQTFVVYGTPDKAASILDFFDQEAPVVNLPVYGVSIGGNSMLAVIEGGAESSRITVSPSTKVVGINYVYANFQYRRGFDDLRVTARSIKTYDAKAMETDYSMRLLFLDEGKGSYSDMAVRYRDYLLTGGLVPALNEQAIAIDLFMSAPEDGLLFDTQRTVTTLEEAGAILDALSDVGVKGAQVSLKGWASGGYGNNPVRMPVEGAVGSARELTALMEKAAAMNDRLSLTANFLEATDGAGGFSRRNDVVYLSNYAILTDPEEEHFILSPDAAREKLDALLRKADGLGVTGLRFERMGQYLTFNYNSGHAYTSAQTMEIYRDMLNRARDAFGHVSVQGGALWLAPYADLLTEIPCEDSGFQFTSKAVPFYQMVMHGLRDYTGTPGNLSSDLEREALRWVELGYMPYFELTFDSTEALMYTNYQGLFTAQYTAWIDEVAEIYQAFSTGDLASLRTALMLEHTTVAQNVSRVRYDNGMTVYVNYNDEAVEADGWSIPGRDYLIVKEGLDS